MIYLTKTLNRVLSYVIANPDLKVREIANIMDIPKGNASAHLNALFSRGAVVRIGEDKPYRYRASGKPITMDPNLADNIPVTLKTELELNGADLSEDELFYIRRHLHIPRRELAKKLGMSKVNLNFAMDKYGLVSKLASEEEGV